MQRFVGEFAFFARLFRALRIPAPVFRASSQVDGDVPRRSIKFKHTEPT
jgi:hypothetical protein